ncbi:MAG: TonB-dependent receptor plug domain-containing protein, partial [Bacteroidales bacterium]|nr:TonB-dependent receptor plug domain-containing protein [Bacteroidales bacterium]
MRRTILILFLLLKIIPIYSGTIKGRIYDARTSENLTGATVYIRELKTGTTSGLDGTFTIRNIPGGKYTIMVSYIGYSTREQVINIKEDDTYDLLLGLDESSYQLSQVTITAQRDRTSDMSARATERNSDIVVNVVAARTIELSPDLNVANALQRISGVTIDKSSSSTGQYALIRGMDKRYNYTLVNGIKIPSTHNKHRYVSLDMFPSELVDRIEVSKTLTPDLEGDAIGGVVNMIMKNAPEQKFIQVNFSSGYSIFFADKKFQGFSIKDINNRSPFERNASGYRAVPSDFPRTNLVIKQEEIPVNYTGNITLGSRFTGGKLGWIFSGSFQNYFTGENSLYFKDDLSRDGKNLPVLTSMQERVYYELKKNLGIHNKLDYRLNRNNSFQLYTAYMYLSGRQIRQNLKTDLAVSYDPDNGNLIRSYSTRFRYNPQDIFNITLTGDHSLPGRLTVNWSAVYSKAKNQRPDEATITYGNSLENFLPVRQYVDFDGSSRIWRRNSDEDIAFYVNLVHSATVQNVKIELQSGGMARFKHRTSFYNKYTLKAITHVNTPDTTYTSYYSEKDVDWQTYDQIEWMVYNPRGTVSVGENYDAYENVVAGYLMGRVYFPKLQVTGGIRIEHTDQGYNMAYPVGEPEPEGFQKYFDFLPGIHFKYLIKGNQNLRLSYFRATNKPGFQEIVPYIDSSDEPVTAGNKNLKHAEADNIDIRWELFPNQNDQVLGGVFYKRIINPIEFAFDKFMNVSQNIVYTPVNSKLAVNYGFEIDIIRFAREWGVKANYTFTRSEITTNKLARVKDEHGNDSTAYIPQTRPLFGQSPHMGNISLLYRGSGNGFSGQLAFSYTGERIFTVSRFINNDLWQEGFWQLDASAEKKFRNGISIFIKAHNLLDTHVKVNIKASNPINNDVPSQDSARNRTLVRNEFSRQSFLA